MPEETESGETSLESLVATLVISVTVVTPFVLLAAGVWWFWIIFVVGFAGVLPAAVQLTRWHESRRESQSQSHTESDPLESLRERYASGEIDEAEFERRVEQLLETESETETDQFYGGRERDRFESGSERGESDSTDREFERELDRN